ncbi:unnamed protein product, partial [Musa acuminata var. zebrina]
MEWLEEVTSMRFVVCVVVPVTLLLAASTRWRRKLPFPPGPTPLPIVGNMLMMGQLTHRGLAKLAERYGGLCHLRLGFVHVFAVSTSEIARQVLQVQDAAFSNRFATIAITYLTYDRAEMAFAHYGPFWRQMRKLCVMKLFSKKRAVSWASVREEVDAAVRAGAAVNLGELMFNLTKNITFRAAFGTQSHENQEEFIAILQEFSLLFGAFNIGDFIPWVSWMDLQGINKRFKVAREALDGFIDKIIEEHMANPKEADAEDSDMVDEMLAFFEESRDRTKENEADELQRTLRLTRNNIKAIIMDVMFGGTETVASAIEWAMAELMKNPEDMRRVQEELASVVGLHRKVRESDLDKLPHLKCAVKETLRLHPPNPHPTPRDRRGLPTHRLRRPRSLPHHDQRVGHRPRQISMGGRGSVPAVEVRPRRRGGRARLQGRRLRVPALRVGAAVVPGHAAGASRAGARGGSADALLQLGAARRNEARRARHGGHVRAHSAEGGAAGGRPYATTHLSTV